MAFELFFRYMPFRKFNLFSIFQNSPYFYIFLSQTLILYTLEHRTCTNIIITKFGDILYQVVTKKFMQYIFMKNLLGINFSTFKKSV